jgi:hypothetical protein
VQHEPAGSVDFGPTHTERHAPEMFRGRWSPWRGFSQCHGIDLVTVAAAHATAHPVMPCTRCDGRQRRSQNDGRFLTRNRFGLLGGPEHGDQDRTLVTLPDVANHLADACEATVCQGV